jgi:diacylglycerol kinase family enzyme
MTPPVTLTYRQRDVSIEIDGVPAGTGIMPKLYSGAHVHHPKVRTARGTSFRFDSAVETLVDLDGEMVGRLPLEVTVLPQAFRVGAV